MDSGCVEEQIFSLPIGWLDAEFLMNSWNDFEIIVCDDNNVFAAQCHLPFLDEHLSDVWSWFYGHTA